MSDFIAHEDSDGNKALLDPDFRELLTMIMDIKKNHSINYFDYNSFDDFAMSFLSSLDTNALKRIKRVLDSSGTPDKVLDAVLEARLTDTTKLAVNN